MARKKKGRGKRQNVQAAAVEPEELVRAPHSFIFHRGLVGKHIIRLLMDFRHVMEPFTATNLRARKSNCIKDYVAASGLLHVSHMLIFTQTVLSPYVRIIRLPRGPTLTFKIHSYTHSNDVLSSLRKQYAFNKIFLNPPLVILNGFTGEDPHIKLMVATFQGMFPTINVTSVNLKNISRCVLFNYNPETKTIDFRHYVVRAVPVGISKAVKKLGKNKIPDLSRFTDVAEFMTKAELLSDSEVEDDPNNKFSLPQSVGPRAPKGNQAAVRLTEYGPRITLQLIKVEEGIMEGEVMFHEYITKTDEEVQLIRKGLETKKKLLEKRKREQTLNVKRKQVEKEAAKQKSLEGMRRAGINVGGDNPPLESKDDEDDDAEWYRKEVGEEPDPDLFQPKRKSILKRKLPEDEEMGQNKKPKTGTSIRWGADVKFVTNELKMKEVPVKNSNKKIKQPAKGKNKNKGKNKKATHNKTKTKSPGTKVKKGARRR